jgi:hypothetical protein
VIAVAHPASIQESLRFEPEPIHIRAYPGLTVSAKLIIRSVGTPFQLIEEDVHEDLVVHEGGFADVCGAIVCGADVVRLIVR